jgi:uncharacterized protein
MESDDTARLSTRRAELQTVLGSLGSVVIAYSGGVDSSLLLRVAADTDGLRFIAVTTHSPTTPRHETDEARALASSLGAHHIVREVDELETPGYAANPANRCYLCKQTLYPVCFEIAHAHGLARVVDGVNHDDLSDYRPGLVAAAELGVRHPLADVGLTKADVRSLSSLYGLPTADKPASPCLSSRFPYGTRITHEGLEQVAAAEAVLRRLGFRELRVRYLGTTARVEVASSEQARLADPVLRANVVDELERLGFSTVEISTTPLRSGSLNDVLAR